jgi:hypothetical protein
METHPRHRTPKNRAYRIVVRAEIGQRFALAFEGMEVKISEGRTIITGEVIDQSHLHGILDRINALGLELVSVQPAEPQRATRWANREGHEQHPSRRPDAHA